MSVPTLISIHERVGAVTGLYAVARRALDGHKPVESRAVADLLRRLQVRATAHRLLGPDSRRKFRRSRSRPCVLRGLLLRLRPSAAAASSAASAGLLCRAQPVVQPAVGAAVPAP